MLPIISKWALFYSSLHFHRDLAFGQMVKWQMVSCMLIISEYLRISILQQ